MAETTDAEPTKPLTWADWLFVALALLSLAGCGVSLAATAGSLKDDADRARMTCRVVVVTADQVTCDGAQRAIRAPEGVIVTATPARVGR